MAAFSEVSQNISGKTWLRALVVATACLSVASCSNTQKKAEEPAHINNETKFTSKEFGVKGSPRITTKKRVKKGGGYYRVGKPYTIRGKKYYPKEEPNYVKTGVASWYGPNFHGRLTANGEIYDQYALSAAHPTMPLPSYARVTNLDNGSAVTVRVNDRGPYAHGRLIDLSAKAAQLLGYEKQGTAKVRVEYIGKARLDGLDEKYLQASYNSGSLSPSGIPVTPNSRIVLADASVPRQTLEQVDGGTLAYASGNSIPVPQGRPTSFGGLSLEVTNSRQVYSNEPILISGYVAENWVTGRIDQAFAFIDGDTGFVPDTRRLDEPSRGMNNLVRLRFGPFASNAGLQNAETILQDSGLLQKHAASNGNLTYLELLTAEEAVASIVEMARNRDLPVSR